MESSEGGKFLLQMMGWLQATLKRTPAENRRIDIRTTRYWSLRIRLPFLFQIFLSDLWIIPFKRIHDLDPIWNFGSKLIWEPMDTIRNLITHTQ